MRGSIAAAALAVAALVSLGACSGNSGSASSSGPVTITWWDTSDATNEAPTFKALVADFEKANPDIKVTYVSVPFADARSKFETAAGSKGAPDVLRADVGWTAAFAQAGFLVPLDGTSAAADQAKFEPQLIQQAKYGGKLYGMPEVTDTLALMYNKKLYAQAGITKPPATWDELKADQALIKSKTGMDGFAVNPQLYFVMPFLFGEGTDMIDSATKKITIDSPPAVKALDTVKALIAAPGAAKLDTTSNGYANILDAFRSGKLASSIEGPWETANVYKGSAFTDKSNLGIAEVPAGSTGKRGAPIGGHNLVVYAGSAHQAAAEKFIAFMTSATSQVTIATKNATLPTRSDAYTAEVNANPGIRAFQQVLSAGMPRQAVPQYSSLYDSLGIDLVKILSGQEATVQGLHNAAIAAQKLLPGYSS